MSAGKEMGQALDVQRQYARHAAHYDQRWARYLEGTLDPTLQALHPERGDRLLDVGCGTGLLLERIARHWPAVETYGVDVSSEMLTIARERLSPPARLVVGDVHWLPFAPASFDAVVSTSSLHHWGQPARALAEIARVTRPGGRLTLTDWSDDHRVLRVFSRVLRHLDSSLHRSYRAAEVGRLLREAGFVVRVTRHYRVGWLWGMMTITADKHVS